MSNKPKKRKILLIGWDSADWKIINPLLDSGQMPALESLVNNGVIGNLSTLEPAYSPMLWTTIATGKLPDKHGVLGFTEPIPNEVGIRPISSLSRKTKAIWNILMQNGYNVNTVGWWPSHPVEQLNGICISDLYKDSHVAYGEKWEMLEDTVHPKELQDMFAKLRVHPDELTQAHILPFVPNAAKINQDLDKRLYSLAKNVAECSSLHAATTWIMENTDWDFLAVYKVAIDHLCHTFMNYHPPKMDHIATKEYEIYNNVINGIYIYHDMMLDRLLELAGKDTTVILLSDHGFHSDHLRPKLLPMEPASPALQHRKYGIICVKGPGIKKDERVYGASLLAITPTILTMCGLPVGEDMDGVPLIDIFEEKVEITKIPSWENIDGDCGMHDQKTVQNPFDSQEAVQRLVDLGYIEEPNEDMQKTVEYTVQEAQYNLARVYIGSGRQQKAIPILLKLYNEKKDDVRFVLNLISCYNLNGQLEESSYYLNEFRQLQFEKRDLISKRSDLIKKLTSKKVEPSKRGKVYFKLKEIHTTLSNLANIDMVEADILFKQGEFQKALKKYEQLESSLPTSQQLIIQKGNTLMKLGNFDEAIVQFNNVLNLNPDSNVAYHGLSICYYKQELFEESVEAALVSIGLVYYNSVVHFQLAKSLFSLKLYKEASEACEVSLSMSPKFGMARNLLIDIYENYLNDKEKALIHKQFFSKEVDEKIAENNKTEFSIENFGQHDIIRNLTQDDETIFVVSGLPRSGTSMIMQMLANGGLEVFTDSVRKADESNPKGYYEHEAVKRMARDNSWVHLAKGKSVKIISHLLPFLPMNYKYKIIFVLRDIDEVVMSQQKMLVSLGKSKEMVYPVGLKETYEQDLRAVHKWISETHNAEMIFVNFADTITTPLKQAQKINLFLKNRLEISQMVTSVREELYRTKNENNVIT